jgi:type VI secretion system secreted protein VgrG
MALLGRDTVVSGPLPEGALLLETLHGTEMLGAPYSYRVTLLSQDPAVDPDQVLGQMLTIRIKLDSGAFRYFTGIVTYFAKTGIAVQHTRYAAVLHPRFTLLDYTRDCRIYFDVKGPELAAKLMSQYGADVDSNTLKDDYRKREYLVQYRESYANFIQRLLEDEGAYYYFEHFQDKHTMVFADSSSAHGSVPGYEAVLYLPRERKQASIEEHFWSLSVAGSLFPGKFTSLQAYDYNKARPRSSQLRSKPSAAGQPGADYEDYDNPDGLIVEADAEGDATVRLESDRVANTIIEVEGNTMGLGVGKLVKMARSLGDVEYNPFWTEGDFSKEYLITSATYSISINQYETGDVAPSDEPYRASYTLLDSQIPFRPRRRAHKPRIEGPQTAVVVGPSGEEIYTDGLGRVKVQFDWDRLGESDQKSSCWVRVAQVWAGKKWGAVHTPRIGHEVIVEFLDGDPDRPIITGRVYNNDNQPPYLPDSPTQSGIKSHSSKGGSDANYNEIRFEDKKGSEEIHIQAEKDMSTVVENDETHDVGHDRKKHVVHDETTNVDANRTEEVGKDETITIHGNRTETVDKNETITIHGNRTETVDKNEDITIHGNRTETVDKNESITVSGNRTETVDKNESITVTGARSVEVTKTETLSVKDARKQSIDKDDTLKVGKKLVVDAGDEIVLKTGDASITMKKDGTITLKGKDITLTGSGKINVKASGDVIVKGSKISGN